MGKAIEISVKFQSLFFSPAADGGCGQFRHANGSAKTVCAPVMKKHENLKVGQYDRFLGFIFGLLNGPCSKEQHKILSVFNVHLFIFYIQVL
jgi:hypothetical protein